MVQWLSTVSSLPILGVPVGLALVALGGALLGSPVIVGVFLLCNFTLMLRKEGRTRATLLSGLVGVGMLAYVAGLAASVLIGATALGSLLLGLGLPLLALATGFVSFVVYSNFYMWWFGRHGGPVEAVIVLGGALRGAEVSPLLGRRIERGLKLARREWAQGHEIPMIMSGGQGPDEVVSEAEAMASHAVELGAPANLVWKEDRSTTTEENLAFTAHLLRQRGIAGPVAVATNDYHAFRAATMMRRAGVPGYAVGYLTARYYWPAATIREYLAILRDHRLFVMVVLGLLLLPLAAGVLGTLFWPRVLRWTAGLRPLSRPSSPSASRCARLTGWGVWGSPQFVDMKRPGFCSAVRAQRTLSCAWL